MSNDAVYQMACAAYESWKRSPTGGSTTTCYDMPATARYVVALGEHQGCPSRTLPAVSLTAKDVDQYLIENGEILVEMIDLGFGSKIGVGLWTKGSDVVLDIVGVFDEEEWARKTAIEHNQEAYYDLVENKVIYVGGDK